MELEKVKQRAARWVLNDYGRFQLIIMANSPKLIVNYLDYS